MSADVTIVDCDPSSPDARAMAAALWDEIQTRYGFVADDPFDPAACTGPVGGFWLALHDGRPVGSIALAPLSDGVAEVDVMYVSAEVRGAGVAQALLTRLEEHARAVDVSELKLRAGEPQPEALRFYEKAGFTPIPAFGRWVGDSTARCFAKTLTRTPG